MAATIDLLPPSVFNAELSRCWEALQGGRTIAVYRCLIDITGSLKSAAMLSQLLYWSRVSKEVAARDGWIYKSVGQMQEETGLTPREQDTCKGRLKKLNLIQTSRKGVGAPLALKVNLDELSEAVCRHSGHEGDLSRPLTLPELQSRSSLFFRRYFSKRVAYHRDLVTLTGCIHSAVMLTSALQDAVNQINTHKHHAFSSLTASEWQERIALSDKSQRTARNRLKNLKFIFEKHFIASRRIFTLVNGRAILEVIRKLMTSKNPSENYSAANAKKAEFLRLAERAKKDWRKGPNMEEQGFQGGFSADLPSSKNMTFGIDKREDSESTNEEIQKPQNRKSISDKWSALEPTNEQIVIYLNYKGVFNYNYKTVLPNKKQAVQGNVVVVDEELIYPKTFNKTMQEQAQTIFGRYCPNVSLKQRQEILDEISGQLKPVNSPLGLLMTFCKLAGQNQFTAMVAHKVSEARKTQALNRKCQEEMSQLQSERPDSPYAGLSVEELREMALNNVKKAKIKGKFRQH